MAKSKKSKASKRSKKEKAPKVPKSLRKGSLPRPVEDVWAAGVGALAQAGKKGGDSFDSLVALGSSVVDRGGNAATAAVEQVEQAAASLSSTALGVADAAVDEVADRLEGVVEAALGRLGVPGRDEVLALRGQVEVLEARLAVLLADAASAAEPAPEPAPEVYEVKTHERGWAVQRVGAERASAVHPTKKEALVDARQTAHAHAPSRLLVYKTDGSLADETAYDAP